MDLELVAVIYITKIAELTAVVKGNNLKPSLSPYKLRTLSIISWGYRKYIWFITSNQKNPSLQKVL